MHVRRRLLCCVVHQKAVPVHSVLRSYFALVSSRFVFDSVIPVRDHPCDWFLCLTEGRVRTTDGYQPREEDAAGDRVKAEHGSVVHHFGCARLFDMCTILVTRSPFSNFSSETDGSRRSSGHRSSNRGTIANTAHHKRRLSLRNDPLKVSNS